MKAIDKGTSAREVTRMFHASAVPDLAEPRRRTLLVAGVTGAGPVAMIVFPPNPSGQTYAAKILPAKILPAMASRQCRNCKSARSSRQDSFMKPDKQCPRRPLSGQCRRLTSLAPAIHAADRQNHDPCPK